MHWQMAHGWGGSTGVWGGCEHWDECGWLVCVGLAGVAALGCTAGQGHRGPGGQRTAGVEWRRWQHWAGGMMAGVRTSACCLLPAELVLIPSFSRRIAQVWLPAGCTGALPREQADQAADGLPGGLLPLPPHRLLLTLRHAVFFDVQALWCSTLLLVSYSGCFALSRLSVRS